MESTIFVVVAERDTYESQPDSHPIVFEQHTDNATIEKAKAFQQKLGDRYGQTRIAKLVFVDA